MLFNDQWTDETVLYIRTLPRLGQTLPTSWGMKSETRKMAYLNFLRILPYQDGQPCLLDYSVRWCHRQRLPNDPLSLQQLYAHRTTLDYQIMRYGESRTQIRGVNVILTPHAACTFPPKAPYAKNTGVVDKINRLAVDMIRSVAAS